MTLQEILTYVEEIEFKNAMFGYDKDEVDIQLDKICDEVEALVTKKDKEIEELKKALTIVNTTADAQPEDMAAAFATEEEAPAAAEQASEDVVTREQYEAVQAECTQLKVALEQAQAEIAAAKDDASQSDEAAKLVVAQIDSAQAMVNEAQEEVKAAREELKAAKEEVEELKAELEKAQTVPAAEPIQEAAPVDDTVVEELKAEIEELKSELEKAHAAAQAAPMEETTPVAAEEVSVKEAAPAQNSEQAYSQYMMYADLLCKQLAEVETKHDKIVTEATAEADQIRANAQTEADQILADAQGVMDAKSAEASEAVQGMLDQAKAEAEAMTAGAKEEAEATVASAKEEAEAALASAKAEAEEIVSAAKAEAETIGKEYMESAAVAEEQCKQLQEKKDTLLASLSGFGEEISALLSKFQEKTEE